MKKFLKALGLSGLLVITCLGFYAFKKYQQVKTAADIFRSVMYSGIYTEGYSDTQWPDSTMTVEVPTSWDTTRTTRKGALSICGNSPAYFYRNMAEGIGATEVEYGYKPEALLNFKQAFGKDLLAPGLKIPGKDDNGKPKTMNQFKADALKTAFDKLYKKPGDDFDGFAMQKIYDIAAKTYFRSCAYVIAKVMDKKAQFVKFAQEYKTAATTNKNFYGPKASSDIADKLLGKDYSPDKDCMEYGADRIVGMMLRRQIDGTLPTLISCVKIMLQDYDPDFFDSIKSRL